MRRYLLKEYFVWPTALIGLTTTCMRRLRPCTLQDLESKNSIYRYFLESIADAIFVL